MHRPRLARQMERRAIKQRWPITDSVRQALYDRQVKLATGEHSTFKEAAIATKIILEMDRQNLVDEQLTMASVDLNQEQAKNKIVVLKIPDNGRGPKPVETVEGKLAGPTTIVDAMKPTNGNGKHSENGNGNGNGNHH